IADFAQQQDVFGRGGGFRRRGGGLEAAAGVVHHLHQDEHHQGQQDEVHEDGQEVPPGEDDGAGLGEFGGGHGAGVAFGQAQDPEQVVEIDLSAQDEVDDRHDQVIDDRIDDLAEGTADDDPDRQVHHVALDGKFLEFFDETPGCAHFGLPPSIYPTGRNAIIRG